MIPRLCSITLAIAISLLALIPLTGWGEIPPFEQIDRHARNAPDQVTRDVAELAAYLTKPATNNSEKVRGFYVWITENIAYDVRAFTRYRPGRYHRVPPDEVLKRRKAVCQGYAELFQALCHSQGIRCELVPGYSKGLTVNEQDFTRGDHAWNAVQLEGQWYLLDVTWGSGGLDERMFFVKEFSRRVLLS